ncbi:Crp/Fnr family transcriptional regulator [Limosilactobacillus panis]|jgi:CRP-like cAMP-binding protein|uniref:CRP FNR family transcriptional regulator n=1 Tax=Limosilactobacillus panis DSM 6035 TaxID=1423782 RepID=A0A0R1XBP2_9LACO|nr:Crp/Fnr family transcriptional regulator [Limosilactobacillus panis]KRM27591.1 CRP FNR family transcriptional regulator [Limosilactobacillus panis DSM 6035]
MAEELCVRLVPLFNQLNVKNQRQVEQLVHHEHVTRGTIIVSPATSNRLVIIRRGRARMYQLSINGEEQVQRILTTGDYVGETWLLGVANTSSYVDVMTDSEICVLYRADFIRLIQDYQDIALRLLTGQAMLINDLRWQTQLLGIPTINERLNTYLRWLAAKQGSSTVTLPLKLKDLSSYLGTTPETLSRKLTQLQKDGVISRHLRQIKILKETY